MSDYEPFDQEAWLGKPPWKPTDRALIAWETAHGHDVRTKCYAEYGCHAIEDALDRELDTALTRANGAEAALDRVREALDDPSTNLGNREVRLRYDNARAALDIPGPSREGSLP